MHEENDTTLALASMFDEGWITEVLYEVKSGKEATLYCCRGGVRSRETLPCCDSLIAAKVYRDYRTRRFKNDAVYQAGRAQFARPSRVKRAIENRSAFGREASASLWLSHEWTIMRTLVRSGCDVLQPMACNDRAILMPFVGDDSSPAPMLHEADVPRHDAARLVDRILRNVEIMLDLHIVHGDLSPYNVLYWERKITIIDFPQAVDPRMNPAARSLLARDVENICRWGAKHGVKRDAGAIVNDLWQRFRLGEIG